jgi:isoleucyl-tRNA synthetase
MLHPRTPEILEQVAKRVEQGGIEAWQTVRPEEVLGTEVSQYEKSRDTLDVWFDSGSTHYTVLRGSHRAESEFPADLYLEGSDQHRGWFHSSLLVSCMLDGRPPYKGLLTHGFVIDLEGRKMSKSKGNTMAPQEISSTLGAEILRLWVASADYSGELTISAEILKRVVESYRRVRNTLRFLLANTSDFDPAAHAVPIAEMVEIDRYALAITAKMQEDVARDYAAYQFHLVSQKLLAFCSEDLGSFYLDILKDRLYTCRADSKARRSAQTTLWHITNSLLRLMAPLLSFTAEEAWRVFARKGDERGDDSVFFHTWQALPDPRLDADTLKAWADVRQFRELVSKGIEEKRIAKQLGSSLQAEVDILASGPLQDALARLAEDLRFVLITSRASVKRADGPVVVQVTPSTHPKCDRCWHYRADVNGDGLCGRCVSNLQGSGEPRTYA